MTDMKGSWRVSKYDPERRDPDGSYAVDEWTSVNDVGKTFGGRPFTAKEYLRVEGAYVSSIAIFYRSQGSPQLVPLDVEVRGPSVAIPGALEEPRDSVHDVERLEKVVRSCLREISWCRLESSDGSCKIHFGYDYYVYLIGRASHREWIGEAARGGLFVEERESPYAVH